MATQFKEVRPNYGVDENAAPIPEMIVPLRGTNHILLIDGDGIGVPQAEKPNILEITEVKDFVRKDLPNPRMFRLKGKALPGEGGLLVLARRGTTVIAQLRVFVVDNRIVRLAVRPLQTAPGVFHAKVRPDPVAFVYEMNEIWAPQANVLVDLLSDKPALIDDPDQNARDMGAFEADGFTPDTKKGVFDDRIRMITQGKNFPSFAPVFLSYLGTDPVKNSDFTLFVVHAINAFAGHTTGLTDPSHKFALVSEDAPARDWAHELGHHLGGPDSRETGELMVSGGKEEKIPVQDAVNVFNRLHT
jgi:hypothetical protein